MSVAIGDSWLYTSGSSTFNVPASGTYKLEVCGGGGGGASSWWSGAISYGGGGGGGYAQTSKYLYAGASLNYAVGSGGGAASATGAVQGAGSGGTSQITGPGVSLYGYGGGGGYSDVWSGSGGAGGTGSGGANTSGGAGGSAWGLYNQFAGGGSSAVPPYGKGGSSYWNGSWGELMDAVAALAKESESVEARLSNTLALLERQRTINTELQAKIDALRAQEKQGREIPATPAPESVEPPPKSDQSREATPEYMLPVQAIVDGAYDADTGKILDLLETAIDAAEKNKTLDLYQAILDAASNRLTDLLAKEAA